MFYEVGKYDIKGKNLLKTLNKILYSRYWYKKLFSWYNKRYRKNTWKHTILELLRRDYKIYSGKFNNTEVDFLSEKNGERVYLQVCETILGKKQEKENWNH